MSATQTLEPEGYPDVVETCLLVIDSSLEEREFTDSEVDAYRQAMQLPVYSGSGRIDAVIPG